MFLKCSTAGRRRHFLFTPAQSHFFVFDFLFLTAKSTLFNFPCSCEMRCSADIFLITAGVSLCRFSPKHHVTKRKYICEKPLNPVEKAWTRTIRAGRYTTTISTAQYTVGLSVTDWKVNLTLSHFISEKQISQHTISYIRSDLLCLFYSQVFKCIDPTHLLHFCALRVIWHRFTRKAAGGATHSSYTHPDIVLNLMIFMQKESWHFFFFFCNITNAYTARYSIKKTKTNI